MNLNAHNLVIRPMVSSDLEALTVLASDPEIWLNHRVAYHQPEIFEKNWFEKALEAQVSEERLPFTLIWQGNIAGSSSFYDISHQHKRLTIGYTWYGREYWGTLLNPTAKLLLMQYAFETLGFLRVAFCIDLENHRSCRAVEKLGAKKEGVWHHHMIRADGTHRDSVIYAVIQEDWPQVKAGLLRQIGE